MTEQPDDVRAPSAGMPPLGPPYGPAPETPPRPRFPESPPKEWPLAPLIPPEPPAAPPPSHPWRALRPAVVAAIVTFVVVLAGAFVWNESGSTRFAIPRSTTTTSPRAPASSSSGAPTTTTTPAQLDAIVADIKAFVEKERGLQFKQDVPVKVAADDEFDRLLDAQLDDERAQYDELQQVLEPLGLVPAGTDVNADERTLLHAGVLGFYDPKTKSLTVRGTDTTPLVRRTLAHELTHALDDQWFGLDREQLDRADDESSFAFSALTEGSARRVDTAYLNSMSPADRRLEASEELQLLAQHPELVTLPSLLVDLVNAPYANGEPLVEKLLANGGRPRLDSAFGAPPVTSAQVLDPALFLAGTGPISVTAPDPDGGATPANRGVLGAFLLGKLFAVGGADSSSATDEWGGDRYVTWADGTRTCIKDALVGADAVATAHLGERLAAWARAAGATVTQNDAGALEITACR